MNKGRVFLVGAGTGDENLLTIKAKKLIEKSDVVLYDKLVSEDVMDFIPTEVELIDVGKSTNNHKVKQEDINKILLKEALKGKTVVRLKGGDPFVFGRGGEELTLLKENNIYYEVVPGITSSIAAATYAGIPVTHRDFCSSLHIITGHSKKNEPLNIDFKALNQLNGTLVFMMSVATINEISKGLIKAGMSESMPCAVVENGTRYNQRSFISTLKNIGDDVLKNNVKSPAVILVGKVCSLGSDYSWFNKKILSGKSILVTQPVKKKSRLYDSLKELGANVKLYPCIKTTFNNSLNIPLKEINVAVFTSDVGVESFFNYIKDNDIDVRQLSEIKFVVVGPQTKKTLKKYGIIADFMPSVYNGTELIKEMIETEFINQNTKTLLLRGDLADKDVLEMLKSSNVPFLDIEGYKTSIIKRDEQIDINKYDYITFTSKSCVKGFVESSICKDFSGVTAICIGEKTFNEANKYNFKVEMSKECTIDSMVELILKKSKEENENG